MRVSIKSKVVNIKLQCYLITGWMDLYDIFIETHVILLNFPALEIKRTQRAQMALCFRYNIISFD